MKKLILFCMFAISLLATNMDNIVPTNADFQACYKKMKDSIVYVDGMFGVVVKPNLVIVPRVDNSQPKKYIKYDPYLRLYLVRSSSALVPVKMKEAIKLKPSDFVGVVDGNDTKMGHIKSFSNYLGELDSLNFTIDKPGILMPPCCSMLGLAVGSNKFIGSRYIEHFIKTSDVEYGDLGVKFSTQGGKIIVSSVNPFGRWNVFAKGDEIISLNGKKPDSIAQINDAILFTSNEKDLKFVVKRKGVDLSFIIKSANSLKQEKDMATKMPEKPAKIEHIKPHHIKKPINNSLAFLGAKFDKNMFITSISQGSLASAKGLLVGDRLLQVEMKPVKSLRDVAEILGQRPAMEHYLLFDRNNFQFFLRVVK